MFVIAKFVGLSLYSEIFISNIGLRDVIFVLFVYLRGVCKPLGTCFSARTHGINNPVLKLKQGAPRHPTKRQQDSSVQFSMIMD